MALGTLVLEIQVQILVMGLCLFVEISKKLAAQMKTRNSTQEERKGVVDRGFPLGQTSGLELTLIKQEIKIELNWKSLPFEVKVEMLEWK